MLDATVPHGLPRYWKPGYLTDVSDAAIAHVADAHDRKPTALPSWDFDALAQRFEPGHADAAWRGRRGMRDATRRTRAASTSTSSDVN